jgi:hypothetical protein
MSDIPRIYTTALYNNFRPLYANWDPDKPVQLGDYGILRGRMWIYLGNLRDKVPFKERASPNTSHKMFASKGTTQLTFHAKGSVPVNGGVNAKATLEINFSSEESVFFNAAACTYRMVSDKVALGKTIRQMYSKGEWNRAWAVITDLIDAGATTVAVSGGHSASIVLEATGDVGTINLADASIGLGIKTSTNVGYQIVAATKLTPLLGLCKIQRAFPWISEDFTPLALPQDDTDALAEAEGPRRCLPTRESCFSVRFAEVGRLRGVRPVRAAAADANSGNGSDRVTVSSRGVQHHGQSCEAGRVSGPKARRQVPGPGQLHVCPVHERK